MQSRGAGHEQVGLCPHCHSPDIRVRRQRHQQMLWRCRNCNRVFATPAIGAVSPAEWPNVDLVRPHWIRAMEQGARQQPQSKRGQAQEGNLGCGCLVIILIVIGIASFFAISRNADFPGADTLRTAGNEAAELYHRVAGDGEDPGEQEAAKAAPTPTQRHTSTPALTPTPTPLLPPDRRHYEYKTYMLELINVSYG